MTECRHCAENVYIHKNKCHLVCFLRNHVGPHETAKGQGVDMPSDIDQGPCLSTNQNQPLFLALVIVSSYFFDISKQFPLFFFSFQTS